MASSGSTHSLFLDDSGSLWTSGANNAGQLATGNTTNTNVCQKIDQLPPMIATSGGQDHSLFLDVEGSVWSCGANGNGQLGSGNNRSKAERIAGLPKITSILAIFLSSFFLDFEGSVWACGYNAHGELGLGDTTNRNKAEKVAGLPRINTISAGNHHSHFVDEEGGVWVCGYNANGELGLGHSTSQRKAVRNDRLVNIVAASGGEFCSMFLDKDGNLFTCGRNQHGQLGLGDNTNRNIPEKVNNVPKMCSLSSGFRSQHFLAVDCEGSVWSCGNNQNGQLGVGDCNSRMHFEKVRDIKIKQQQHHANKDVEKEIFKSLASEQRKQVKEQMERAKMASKLSKQQLRENMLLGVIPMAGWASKWNPIHEKSQKAKQSIAEQQKTLSQKQEQLARLQKEIEEIQQGLAGMQEDNETWQFFDEYLEPLVEVETQLKGAFEEKVKAGKYSEFTVDDFSLFLNVCGIETLIPFQRENQLKGEELLFAFSDISVLEINDELQKKQAKFYLKVLDAGKLLKEEELVKSVIWRHRTVEKTLLLLREWDK